MPDFLPFRALRFAPALAATELARLVAPPYDVLSDADVDRLQQGQPHNITRVDVPRGGPARYAQAAALLAAWIDDGYLVVDNQPSFTIYRMRFTDPSGVERDIAGVLGGLQVVDSGAGGVLPHERTTPKASTDRLDLTRACRANLSPVWGLSLASGLAALLREPGDLVGSVPDGGVEHRVERVTDPERLAAISTCVGSDDVLIADGHHRYAVSRTYRDEVRRATGRHDTAAEQTLTFVSELITDQLSVAAIHRLYRGLDGESLRRALAQRFTLTPIERPDEATLRIMEEQGHLVLIEAGTSWALYPKPGAFDGVRALDGVWLEETLAGTDGVEVTYQHGLAEVLAAVEVGEAEAAVLIRPVSVAEIERTAREGLLMPPKSTFFTPKLKTGLVIRPLDEALTLS